MLPPLIPIVPYHPHYLPPGIHRATWLECEQRFVWTKRRIELFDGLVEGCALLAHAGCKLVYLDGSFATDKPEPGDFDVCWDARGVNAALLDPVFLDFSNEREAQKLRFGGEFFPTHFAATPGGITYLEFFQRVKYTTIPKGIVELELP